MEYRRLGNSGLKVSALGLGTNSFGFRADQETSMKIIHHALDNGINFIDTANVYTQTESEQIIGQALINHRHNVVLATKAGLVKGEGPNERGSSRYHLQTELENSLKRLKTDYIDLYQIHTFDPDTPLEETLRTLEDMVRSGKVRYVGASNYVAWEFMKALGISDRQGFVRFISSQTCYSLADRTPENELIPMCLDQGVGIIPYFPLAGGILSGKYKSSSEGPAGSRVETDPRFKRFLGDDKITLGQNVSQLAEQIGCSASCLSIAWLMQRPAVSTIIVGATKVEQLKENLLSTSMQLDEETMKELDSVSSPFKHGDPFASYRLPK